MLVSVSSVAGGVAEAHPDLDGLALIVGDQGVAARRRPGNVRLGAAVHPDPLVGVGDIARYSPSASMMKALVTASAAARPSPCR